MQLLQRECLSTAWADISAVVFFVVVIETALLYLHPIRNKEVCFCLFFPPPPLVLGTFK